MEIMRFPVLLLVDLFFLGWIMPLNLVSVRILGLPSLSLYSMDIQCRLFWEGFNFVFSVFCGRWSVPHDRFSSFVKMSSVKIRVAGFFLFLREFI